MQGHRIILPEDVSIDDPQPLILIGPGKRLRLKNVTLVYAASLPACLQLGESSKLLAEGADGVKMLHSTDPTLEDLKVLVSLPRNDLRNFSSTNVFPVHCTNA